MSGIANLDNLLRLLDDDSEVVRKAVQDLTTRESKAED